MTDPTPEPREQHCGRTRPHPPHRQMIGRYAAQCPGTDDAPAPAAPEPDAFDALTKAVTAFANPGPPAPVSEGGGLRDAITEPEYAPGHPLWDLAEHAIWAAGCTSDRNALRALLPAVAAHYAAQADHLAEHDRAETGALQRQLAEAQAAIERVREFADWCRRNYPGLDIDHRIQAALTPKDPT